MRAISIIAAIQFSHTSLTRVQVLFFLKLFHQHALFFLREDFEENAGRVRTGEEGFSVGIRRRETSDNYIDRLIDAGRRRFFSISSKGECNTKGSRSLIKCVNAMEAALLSPREKAVHLAVLAVGAETREIPLLVSP